MSDGEDPRRVQPPVAPAETPQVAPTVPVLTPPHRSALARLRPATVAGWLALAALIAVAAALLVGVSGGAKHPAAAPRAAGVTAASLPPVQRSGSNYTAATLPALARRLVAAGSTARTAAPVSGALGALASSPEALAACLRATAGGDFGAPVALDAARYAGTPALVAIYPAPVRAGQPPRWQALVVDPDCAPGTFRYFAQFPR